ncbi:MAG TPA: type II secretion system F family protein [Terriglobales bacterium]
MLVTLAYIFAFVAVVMIVQTAATVLFSAGDRSKRVNRRLELLDSGMSRDQVFETLVRRKPPGGGLAEAAPDLYNRTQVYFRQAGITMTPQRFLIMLAALIGVVLVIGFLLLTVAARGGVVVNLLVSTIGAIGLVVIGSALFVGYRRTQRLKRLEEQLPVALDVTIRALRAGHPLITSVKLASEEMADPIGSEFGIIVDETNYGMEFRDALISFAHRSGSEYAHFFAVCVAIQSETGGNLAEVLTNLATVIRNMLTLHLRVKALSAEGRMSATILTVLPIGLVCFLLLTRPEFYTTKFGDPIFWPATAGIIVWFLIGQFMMNRMVNFKY